MLRVEVKVDTKSITKQLSSLARKQVPFATARALTSLARIATEDVRKTMANRFASPVPWTLNAFYAKPATTRDLTAFVGTREFAGKGNPAWKYLQFQDLGGARNAKGMELKLSRLSGGQYVVPTASTPLDQYGNISRGWMTQVLSRLGAAGDQNVSARRSKRLRKMKLTVAASGHRGEYFIGREGGRSNGRALGVWRLVGPGQVQKVLAFTPIAPHYTPRIKFADVIRKSVLANQKAEFDKALKEALATARN